MTTSQMLKIAGILWVGSNAFALENPDELRHRVQAQAQSVSAEDYAFTRTLRIEQSTNGKTEKKVIVETFDPSKPAENRWTLVSMDGAPPSVDELKEFRKTSAKRPVPGYYRLGNYFGSPATTSSDSSGRTLFHFASLPKGTVIVMDSDVSQNATVDATVSEAKGMALAEQVHISVKPMRIKLLMKLERYESTARYRVGPEGKALLMEQTSDMSGSGMGMEERPTPSSPTVITELPGAAAHKLPEEKRIMSTDKLTHLSISPAQRTAAKVAGAACLFTIAVVVFANYRIYEPLMVPGNVAETARNILAHERMFRLAIACNITYCAGVVVLLTALYVILKPVNSGLALAGLSSD